MKDYNLGLMQPGEEREVNAFGDYIRNIGTGSIKVVARNTEKTVKALSTVIGAGGWRSPESEYNHWVVKNNSVIAVSVSVLIGKGEAGESEVKINADVNALTRFDNLTDDGNRFFGGYKMPSGTDEINMMLFNPVGSGISAYIDILRLNCVGSDVTFKWNNSTTGFFDLSLVGYGGKNKDLSNGNAPKAGLWNAGGVYGVAFSSMSTDQYGTPSALDFRNSPILVREGEGFMVGAPATFSMSATFEWFEE